MEHLYKSIEIKNYLINNFPLPDIAVELIISNLKLAIDLNGYTNQMLLQYINRYCSKDFADIKTYLRKKYGKNRNCLEKLKKYQLINVIQTFNVDIPVRPFKINYIDDIDVNIEKDKTYRINTLFINSRSFIETQICICKHTDNLLFIKKTFRQRDYIYYSTNKKLIKNILLIYNYFEKIDLDIQNITNFHNKFDKIYKSDAYSNLYFNTINKFTIIDFNMDISRHLNNLKMSIRDLVDIVDKM